MEKLYTQKEYQLQAEQANKDGLFLYQLVKEQEYTIEVLEYEKKLVEVEIYDEQTGEPTGETKTVEVDDLTKPIMVEEEIINSETGKKEAVIVQKHHTETRTKTVMELAIEPKGYYVCFKDNYTNGEINPYYEDEKAKEERARLDKLSMTRGDVFEALILAKGLTKLQLRSMIEQAELDTVTKALYLNRFDEALEFYRGYPIFDMLGQVLGITSEMLDKFFDTKDYQYLTKKTLTINATPSNAIVTINGVETTKVEVPYDTDVEYSVELEGYTSYYGEINLIEDKVIDVELKEIENNTEV